MAKSLKRELGLWDAVAIGIAAMVGAGIFVVSGIGAKMAGAGVIFAFLIAGVVALLSALSSAELGAAIPREGGTYEYARRLVSHKIGFYTGWLFVSSKLLESATVALAFGAYASFFLNADAKMLAVLAVVASTAVNVWGIRASTEANKIMALIKLAVLAAFALFGASTVKTANFQPLAPSGVEGILAASAIVFFAYTGYARIATLGEEIKNPRKTIPKAILASMAITAFVYIAVISVAIGLVGAKAFAESASPIAAAASSLGLPWLVLLVGLGAAVATVSVLLGDLLASSRTAFAMARNGDLPAFLSQLKNKNPENSVIAAGAAVLALTLAGSLLQIAAFTSLTILLYYAVTNWSALKLPAARRLFSKWVSRAGFACCVGLAVFLPLEQWAWTVGLLALGALYLALQGKSRGLPSRA